MEREKPLILLADDDEQLSEMVLYILRNTGHDVVYALDGEMAIQMVNDFQPDLVLLDVNMPKRDGFAVCRHIKENEVLKRIKVVMFTVRSAADDFMKSGELGADTYLSKPVDAETLLTTIKVLLKKPESSASSR